MFCKKKFKIILLWHVYLTRVAKWRTKYFTLIQCTFLRITNIKSNNLQKNARLHILQDLGWNKIKMQIWILLPLLGSMQMWCTHICNGINLKDFCGETKYSLLLKYFFNGSIYYFIPRISFTSWRCNAYDSESTIFTLHIVPKICIGWCACGLNFCYLQAYKTSFLQIWDMMLYLLML